MILATCLSAGCTVGEPNAAYPASCVIASADFDTSSVITAAPGSDNWAVTWAADGSQYVTFGDGGGFGGSDQRGRSSLGIARIEGPLDGFLAHNVFGGNAPEAPVTVTGKSYGLLAVGNRLWMWISGDGSDESAYTVQRLYYSDDGGRNLEPTSVVFKPAMFQSSRPFFAPTFLQFGPGYSGRRDEFVYMYTPEQIDDQWEVQRPGRISLIRAPLGGLDDPARYRYFAGTDAAGKPLWTRILDRRRPVFRDPNNGVMRTSVTYSATLGRYLLITQQITRFRGGYIGLYEAPQPWGPWHTVLFADAWAIGLQKGGKSVYWNFSNKWSGPAAEQFTMLYTGPGSDNFGAITGRFLLADGC